MLLILKSNSKHNLYLLLASTQQTNLSTHPIIVLIIVSKTTPFTHLTEKTNQLSYIIPINCS